ncbi:MAG TPA: helix-turn-helix domain-containing protein [Spirochaetales bacterium]|nr:helix-turn-helix domain-containing protein [Spirochaetales bacterium]
MERHGEVDDPDACYEYLERIELALMRLELLTRKVETTANEQEDSRQESTPLRGKPLLPQGEIIEQRDAPEFMDVEELAAFLHVSPSTIYHRTRSGDIPTRRIGARLLFSKEEIKAWLTSAKPGSTSAA